MKHLHFQPQTCNFLITVFMWLQLQNPQRLFFFLSFNFFPANYKWIWGNFKDENLCLALITKIFYFDAFQLEKKMQSFLMKCIFSQFLFLWRNESKIFSQFYEDESCSWFPVQQWNPPMSILHIFIFSACSWLCFLFLVSLHLISPHKVLDWYQYAFFFPKSNG